MSTKQTSRHRAVGDEQKEARRQALLDTTWKLFQQTSYEALTIADVAAAAGLAKGTVFLYFRTKEALFLTLVEQELADWFDDVDRQLAALSEPSSIPRMAAIISRSLELRPGMVRLLAILHTILEHNIALAEASRFKQFLLARFTRTGGLLEHSLAFLKPGDGARLLLQSYALLIGVWHLSDPAPIVREALARPELRVFDISFAPTFRQTLEALWYGAERTMNDE